jgi:hypothetical protein
MRKRIIVNFLIIAIVIFVFTIISSIISIPNISFLLGIFAITIIQLLKEKIN